VSTDLQERLDLPDPQDRRALWAQRVILVQLEKLVRQDRPDHKALQVLTASLVMLVQWEALGSKALLVQLEPVVQLAK
jgi:hypothetical protein